jgi:FtsP/CotA-like multicopper oxidase with cupredoxin domain
MGQTEHQSSMGLDGLFIVQDDAEAALALPRTYGVDDIPLVVSDVRFDAEGQFDNSVQGYIGTLGDELLVNGTHAPYLDVSTDLVRLRLVNASTSRVYNFGFSDNRSFSMIASDGGLLEKPAELSKLQLSPGERAEVVVRMVAGEGVVLRSTPPDLGTSGVASERNGGADSFDVLQLRAATTLTPEAPLPETLVPMMALAANDAAQIRSMVLNDAMINNASMDLNRIDLVAHLNTSEVWVVSNAMALPHNFHIHDVQFQILDVSGQKPPPELAGWKDTVYMPPGVQFRLIMRFADYADPRSPYMFHCHLLTHEDKGMMEQFVVIEPGDEALVGIASGSSRGVAGSMDSDMAMP